MIPVYSAEIDAGIAELIKANASVAYTTNVEHFQPSKEFVDKVMKEEKSRASIGDSDLYFTKSLLATTNWNKNDDVFSPVEMWAARHTPAHKPDNLNHNQKIIVGHMIDSWAVDFDGQQIHDDTPIDALPDYYHLLNSAVIYTNWTDEDMKASVDELISMIEAGKAFVSMECIFRGFDYAVITPDGQQKIVARNEQTAFLTKHLRAYGGGGNFEDNKIGRLMKRMTFSGKGYLTNAVPANPSSVVFSDKMEFDFSKAEQINTLSEKNGVLSLCYAGSKNNEEINDMAADNDNKVLTDQIDELKAQVKSLTEQNKSLAESSTKVTVEKLEESVTALTSQKEVLEAANVENTSKNEALQAELDAAKKAAADAATELDTIKAESLKTSRISALVDRGIDKKEASAHVEKYAFLDDEQFADVSELLVKAAKPDFLKKDDEKKDDKKKDAKAEEVSDAEVDELEEDVVVDKAEANLTSDAEVDSTESTRAELVNWFKASCGIGGSSSK